MQLEIVLIRHGETEFNRAGRVQGSLDSPLTDRGQTESRALGRALPAWLDQADQWLVSPQGRARESSRLIREEYSMRRPNAQLPNEEVEDYAREIHCGIYEGLTLDQMDPQVLADLRDRTDVPYPQGESILDVMERGRPVRERILKAARNTPERDHFRAVVVSHGNFIRCFCALLTDLGPTLAIRSLQSNTGVNRLVSRDGGESFKILTWNDISHTHTPV